MISMLRQNTYYYNDVRKERVIYKKKFLQTE